MPLHGEAFREGDTRVEWILRTYIIKKRVAVIGTHLIERVLLPHARVCGHFQEMQLDLTNQK